MSGLSPEQLRKLADDLTNASDLPHQGQDPGAYVRNAAFRTLARSLLELAHEAERAELDRLHKQERDDEEAVGAADRHQRPEDPGPGDEAGDRQ